MRRGRWTLAVGLATLGCVHLKVDADGATRVDSLGAVHVETRACAADTGPEDPRRTCVSIQGASLSEVAGGLISGVVGFVLGRPGG